MPFQRLRPQDGAGLRRPRRAGTGELSADRLLSYEKLWTENAYSENAESYLAAKEEKFKKIAMLNKASRKK